jgi:YceI-like protein
VRSLALGRAASVVIALAALASARAGVADPVELAVDGAASSVSYHLVHKLHHVDATAHQVVGRARLTDGSAQILVRVPAAAFDSGNVNRDEHMKETVEAARYPWVELKAIPTGPLPLPRAFPTTETRRFATQVTFHGVAQRFELPVELRWERENRVYATVQFAISLDAFKVERPQLIFVKVDDQVRVEASLLFVRQ